MTLPTKIAVFLSHGTSLVDWKSLGLFDREVGYYRALSSRLGPMLLISYDKPSDEFSCVQRELNGLSPCHNRWSLDYRLFGVAAPILHAKVLRRCDVFRSEQIGGAWTAAIAARLFRKPLVVRCGYVKSIFAAEAGMHPLRQRVGLWLERRCVRAADLVFVTTESDRQYLAETHGVPLDRFRIVPNPIDVDRFRPEPTVEKQPGRVVFVGRFNEQKNLGLLLDACQRLADSQLLLVGTGPLEKELRERADRGNVVFAGNVPNAELPRLLNTAEVFVLPSRYEGCPKALLEAMACGLAVVGTNVIGTRTVIEHGVNGLLCESDPQSMASAIGELLRDPPLRCRLGEAARRHICTNYSQSASIAKEVEAIEALLNRSSR